VLDVQSDRRGAFGDEDRFLLEALADSVAIAIRNANLYQSERWRRQVADSMREVAGLLSAELDLDQVLDAILTELERTLPCDASAIWLLRNGDLCLSAAHGVSAEVCVSEFAADASTWLGRALRSDAPQVRSPDATPEPLGVSLGLSSDYSAIAAPLRVGERRLGLLSLVDGAPGRYGSESRAMTAAFASYAAVAIENTRLYQSAQEQAAISTVMLQVAEAARLLDTLDEVLETVANLVPLLVGVDRCALLLWDRNEEVFRPAAAYGLTPMQQDTFDQWVVAPGDEPIFEELRRTAAPVFIYDVAIDSRLEGAVIWALGFESLLMLPLLAQGEVLGAMIIDYRGDWLGAGTLSLHEEQLVIIQGIAHQAAAAVESTQLREAQQEEAYVSAALLQVAQAVVSLSDLDDVLGTIVRITPLLVGVDQCIIFLWQDESEVFRPAQAYGIPREAEAQFLEARYAPHEFPLLEAVRRSERRVVYPPETEEDDVGAEVAVLPDDFPIDLADGVANGHSLLAVPLAVKGDMLGVMLLSEKSGGLGRSRERRLEIINGVADQAALAVQNYWLHQEMTERERLERELQLAREIQRAFIPEVLPPLPGWGLAATWRAARQVAGDFYDVFQLPDGRLGLVIADVADKGMPAALFMVLTRTLVRAAALENPSPAAVLDRVNDLLVPDARQGMFVTALYAVLDPESGTLTYANAGHNLPLLVPADSGDLVELERGGMALGVMEGIDLEDKIVKLAAGDHLVFYTDGVTEAFSEAGEIYSQERFKEMLRNATGASARGMLDAIVGSVISFTGDIPPSDDLTLIVLCRTLAGGCLAD
jgi:serine phosphatase RsbU (regulator of sigma subunit)